MGQSRPAAPLGAASASPPRGEQRESRHTHEAGGTADRSHEKVTSAPAQTTNAAEMGLTPTARNRVVTGPEPASDLESLLT